MAKNVFIGNSNGKAQKITKMYIGSSDGKAHKIKAAYIGDTNGKARKFWPVAVLPERYQQVLYIGYSNTNGGGIEIPSPAVKDNPRITAVFKTKQYNYSSMLFGCGEDMDEIYNYKGWAFSFNKDYWDPKFNFYFGQRNNNGFPAFQKDTSSSGEGLLYDQLYSVDFNKISNNYSYFYLYCTDGYYSLSNHNLIGSVAKQTFPDHPYHTGAKIKILVASAFNLYSLKIYNQSGGLLRNFYPCRDTQTNYYGLYDMVNRVFFSTNNTGSGLDVGPEYNGEL